MSSSAPTVILRATLTGMAVAMAGTIPRNILFFANLRLFPSLPWSVPLAGIFIWLFWRYLIRTFPENSAQRSPGLRANSVSARAWFWSLITGTFGLVALVVALRLANQFVALPPQTMPDLGRAAPVTIIAMLLAGAPIAGIIEESSFRGLMQGPIERAAGLPVALVISGTMFALAHLDFTPILWPYYVAVAALYGLITHATNSILPAIVLHTAGNLYSNFDLYLHGQAEWQAPAIQAASFWRSGFDANFWLAAALLAVSLASAIAAYARLRTAVGAQTDIPLAPAAPESHS